MKKVFIFISILILFSFVPVDALSNSHIEPINEIVLENEAADYLKSEKLDDGYIIINGFSISRVKNDGSIVWSKVNPYDFKDDRYDYLVEDNYVILSHCHNVQYEELVTHLNHSTIDSSSFDEYTECGTFKLNINTGEVIKRNKDFGGGIINKIGDNYIVTSERGTFLLNSELEAIKANPVEAVNLIVEDNKIYLIEYTQGKIVTLDNNLETVEEKSIDYSDCLDISQYRINNFTKIGNDFYVVDGNIFRIREDGICETNYDANNSSTNIWYYSIAITEDNIVLGGIIDNEDSCTYTSFNENPDLTSSDVMCFPAVVSVFDKEMNFIENLQLKRNRSAIISNLTYSNGSILAKWLWEGNYLGLTEYQYKHIIEPNKSENGSVEVVDSAFAGDKVTFKIVAKEGYALKSIRVVGVKTGTVIEISAFDLELADAEKGYYVVSNNEFLMPDEDIIIEAVFEKEVVNPDTGVSLKIPLILLFSTGCVLFIYSIYSTKKYL